jgi:hypothetical protein
VRPGDQSYDLRRKVWNGSIDRHPAHSKATDVAALSDDVLDVMLDHAARTASPPFGDDRVAGSRTSATGHVIVGPPSLRTMPAST